MGLFDIFKKKPKFNDEQFGELEYTTFGDRINNFFTGTISLDSQKVGINIDADENGPTNGQREFCRELFDRYPKLKKDVIIPFLKKS